MGHGFGPRASRSWLGSRFSGRGPRARAPVPVRGLLARGYFCTPGVSLSCFGGLALHDFIATAVSAAPVTTAHVLKTRKVGEAFVGSLRLQEFCWDNLGLMRVCVNGQIWLAIVLRGQLVMGFVLCVHHFCSIRHEHHDCQRHSVFNLLASSTTSSRVPFSGACPAAGSAASPALGPRYVLPLWPFVTFLMSCFCAGCPQCFTRKGWANNAFGMPCWQQPAAGLSTVLSAPFRFFSHHFHHVTVVR